MNLFEKLFSLKYSRLGLMFNFNLSEPVKSEAIFNDNNYRASGTLYWKGNTEDINKNVGITGKDCKLYFRVRYSGCIRKKVREEFHTMQSTISNNTIKFVSKGSDNNAKYSLGIKEIMNNADTFIMDSTTERNGKRITRNFIHFSSKDLNGVDYEGYFTFTDNAVDDLFKKYLLSLYQLKQPKS